MSSIAQQAKNMLEGTILPFWKALRDDEYGGYIGFVDFDLSPSPKAEKGCILNSRILWFFSEAAALLGREDLVQEAHHAYAFLRDHCLDSVNGGIFWSMTYDGQPLDTTKHTYNQAFAIYALSAYYRLTGSAEALELAVGLFHLIEEHCTDDEGYLEAFSVDWQPQSNEKLSENGVMAAKTMNTLLHVFEGYSGLYQAAKLPEVAQKMRRILSIYENKVFSPQLGRQLVFFDEHYNSIIDLYSYGHDIESSWLMDWGCDLLEDPALSERIHAIDSVLAENVYRHAYYNQSLANECDRGKVDTHRIWWVQAEAVLGFVNQWAKHPEQDCYRQAAADTFRFIQDKLTDHRPGGEWFWRLDEAGVPDPEKPIVEPWKCPYHNGRMCMELIRRNPHVEL